MKELFFAFKFIAIVNTQQVISQKINDAHHACRPTFWKLDLVASHRHLTQVRGQAPPDGIDLQMIILIYLFVFIASLLVDIVPFVGPPAWTVMVLFQIQFDLDIWLVLIIGVTGSAIGRYLYSLYIPLISERFIKPAKNADLQFIGGKFTQKGWKALAFVFLYTLMPLPSTPLFTAVGIARIQTWRILPSFFAGKFISDAAMVLTGDYVATSASRISQTFLSWQNLAGITLGMVIIALFLFIDWWKLLVDKKFRLNFRIWK